MSFKKKTITKWSRRDLIFLFERMELYASAGLNMNKVLNVISNGSTPKQTKALQAIRKDLETGSTLARSLALHIKAPTTIIGLLSHGEASGELRSALVLARQLLEREDELIKKCVSAMLYPFVIGIFSLIMVFALMRGVMPQIVPMLRSLKVTLPLPTRFFMFVSDFLGLYGLWVMLAAITSVSVIVFVYKHWSKSKYLLQTFIHHVPLVGSLVNLYFISIFVRSVGSLTATGISVPEAYASAASTLSFEPLKKHLVGHSAVISRGVALGTVVSGIKRLPKFISSLVTAGEATGTLSQALLHCAAILDRDIEYSLKKITSLIEPIMMAGMGCIVGAIALSIIMPIYDISKSLQH